MKAGIFFSGSGPILILTSYDSITDPHLVQKIVAKGIDKFVSFDVPIDLVKERYGNHYNVILGDLRQQDDLRVLDCIGTHIMKKFSFKELQGPHYYEQVDADLELV